MPFIIPAIVILFCLMFIFMYIMDSSGSILSDLWDSRIAVGLASGMVLWMLLSAQTAFNVVKTQELPITTVENGDVAVQVALDPTSDSDDKIINVTDKFKVGVSPDKVVTKHFYKGSAWGIWWMFSGYYTLDNKVEK